MSHKMEYHSIWTVTHSLVSMSRPRSVRLRVTAYLCALTTGPPTPTRVYWDQDGAYFGSVHDRALNNNAPRLRSWPRASPSPPRSPSTLEPLPQLRPRLRASLSPCYVRSRGLYKTKRVDLPGYHSDQLPLTQAMPCLTQVTGH